MSQRHPVPAAQVPAAGQRALLAIGGQSIALFNLDGHFHAIADSCPHQGSSLCAGQLQGRVIQCRAHGLRFDLASGYLLNSTALKVTTYPVEHDGEQLFIVIEDPAP
ncbi:Rieske 2Fe-2S domain-containing protein [Pseudomonas sp. GV071]|jgi:nitrite reductase/ring-hydroxylating ferredoxin subunit|uniref:Rieske (2Fe-2S) protein n=1 Tax=Pseudomonas sp. GV071 TaxID=2135754 RepID=UPI000D3626CB|nr:Rieske 2Fe-2S domain-containing protein [Pseudomonas sp. GV071]PTQ73176.1 nitrite reductase/ring-hydroxylating ferredoxin subunit [Pseudomonas sp. GV071]